MTRMILKLLLVAHLAILPLFYPKFSGVHNGHLSVSQAPQWHHILHSGNLEQPDGFIVVGRFHFE